MNGLLLQGTALLRKFCHCCGGINCTKCCGICFLSHFTLPCRSASTIQGLRALPGQPELPKAAGYGEGNCDSPDQSERVAVTGSQPSLQAPQEGSAQAEGRAA